MCLSRQLQASAFSGLLFALQMAFLMAASATLEDAKEVRGSDTAADDCVEIAREMLKNYKQAARALTDRHQNLGSAPTKTEDKSQVYMLIMVTTPLFPQ